ncbi:MAG: amidoligase family protein [Oscillospiraceae bacterium]
MENIIYCSRCGCEIAEDESFIEMDGECLCEQCGRDNTVTCERCGAIVWNDDNAGSEGFPLCGRCYDNYYTSCEDCGCIIHQDCAHYYEDDDYPYCDECFSKRENSAIHEYSYKPEPIFYSEGNRYFGVELEIDDGGKDNDNAERLLETANNLSNPHIYIKSDGSLDDGMELVTHPMTLKYHMTEMPWLEVMNSAVHMSYRSHKTKTCGLHIHVNRTAFGDTREIQEECISRVLYFVEHHWEELLKFSRRSESQINRWAARYGYKNNPKEIMAHAKNSCNGRYACVNLTNWSTVEFRMFRGTLKYNTLNVHLLKHYKRLRKSVSKSQ